MVICAPEYGGIVVDDAVDGIGLRHAHLGRVDVEQRQGSDPLGRGEHDGDAIGIDRLGAHDLVEHPPTVRRASREPPFDIG